MNRFLLATLFFTGFWALSQAAGAADVQIVAEGDIVTLVGKVEHAVAYGPPNFGTNPKTDKQEAYFALKLSGAIRVRNPNGDFDTEPTSRVQLVFAESDQSLLNIVSTVVKNRKLWLVGKVLLPETGHHHEVVLLQVQSARVLD